MPTETITLQIKAKHFKSATFKSSQNCAIANAAKDRFGSQHIIYEALQQVRVAQKYYKHTPYHAPDFDADEAKARWHGYGEQLIREIVLTR